MMYSEFVKGTGCKQNEHNYKVFENLNIMYSNSDMTKDEIYEYGKKLVDNSKTEAELEIENRIKNRIKELQESIKDHKEQVRRYAELYNETGDKFWKDEMKWHKDRIKSLLAKVRELKMFL